MEVEGIFELGGGEIDNLLWIIMLFGRRSNNINLNYLIFYSD